ncbi:hypothetical protein BBG20_21065 [Pseudomonas aylmerensis]|uniref:Uncharacterized protein n=1 Tax=Pseudomonas aylmerensis TaxID=1869229 RepID=A0ABX2YRI8_9PSED|nr:hypothetical protein BBG20_21065 [Pseudomonas aylmerensis]
MRGPDDFTIRGGEFLWGAQVVELVVVGLGGFWAEALEQRQRPKAVGFVEIAAMTIRVMFGNQPVALPEKLRGCPINGFADPPPKRVVAIARGLAVGLGDSDEAVLAVVAVFGDQRVPTATSFADQVAEGVVVVMAVALHHQPVAGDDVRTGTVLHQQVAGRIVAEAFLHVLRVVGAAQAGEGVVVVVVFAFASVEQAGEVAGFVVVVLALVKSRLRRRLYRERTDVLERCIGNC